MKKIRIAAVLLGLAVLLIGCEKEEIKAVEHTETEEPVYVVTAEDIAATMSLEDKIWQLFFVDPGALAETGDKKVGGIILFSENISSPEQVSDYIKELSDGFEIPAFIGVDEEGGIVSRLGEKGIIKNNGNMSDVGATGDSANAAAVGESLANELLPLGFNVDFAPVADTLSNPYNKEIGKRSFGSDPNTAGEMAAAQIKAMQSVGLSACAKHFPGHGSTSANSHKGTSVSDLTAEQLHNGDLKAFEIAAEAKSDFVMISHMSLPNVNGSDIPCSLSYNVITEMLKNQLNFEGIAITDAMNMGAISKLYSSADGAVLAVEAGADMLLMPENILEAYNGLSEAVASGRIAEERIDESVLRILRIKLKRGIINNYD